MFRSEKVRRRLLIFERANPRFRPFLGPLFRRIGFASIRNGALELDVRGIERRKFALLFGFFHEFRVQLRDFFKHLEFRSAERGNIRRMESGNPHYRDGYGKRGRGRGIKLDERVRIRYGSAFSRGIDALALRQRGILYRGEGGRRRIFRTIPGFESGCRRGRRTCAEGPIPHHHYEQRNDWRRRRRRRRKFVQQLYLRRRRRRGKRCRKRRRKRVVSPFGCGWNAYGRRHGRVCQRILLCRKRRRARRCRSERIFAIGSRPCRSRRSRRSFRNGKFEHYLGCRGYAARVGEQLASNTAGLSPETESTLRIEILFRCAILFPLRKASERLSPASRRRKPERGVEPSGARLRKNRKSRFVRGGTSQYSTGPRRAYLARLFYVRRTDSPYV